MGRKKIKTLREESNQNVYMVGEMHGVSPPERISITATLIKAHACISVIMHSQLFIMLYVLWVGENKAGGEIWPAPLGSILRAGNVMEILQDSREEWGGGWRGE